jgi:hypothetical protein
MSNPEHSNGTTLATFDPHDHLITVKTVDGPKAHYPFCWRLHEFRLRYPLGIIQADIAHLDIERDLVVVRVTACADGLEAGKGVGLHTGSLTLLDQVTERAKAQALLDLGIGCAWPVIFPDDLGQAEIIPQQYEQSSSKHDERQEASYGHKPARTASTVQALFAKAYKVKATELETRWERYKVHLLGTAIADHRLTEEQLNTLNATASQQYQKLVVERELVASSGGKNGSRPARESEAR